MTESSAELGARYRIRRAVEGDMDRVGEIARQAWVGIHESFRRMIGDEMYHTLGAGWEERKEAQVRGHFERRPDWFRVVVSVETGAVVAFISFRMDEERSMGTIGNNAVAPEVQGQGIGTMMVTCVFDLFRQQGLKYACVGTGMDPGHAPARRTYEKAGFDIAVPSVMYYKYL